MLDFGSSADADTLLKSVPHILSKNELDIRNSFVSDGASIMVGKKNGVAAKLKNIESTLLSAMKCSIHLPLFVTGLHRYKQLKTRIKNTVKRVLTQLWKYFDDSPKETAALLKTQLQMH